MNTLQEVYFELGKLNIQLKQVKKSHFLLPMIARQGVLSLNCNSRHIEFEMLFSPNVADNPSKEVLLIVKQIKTINDITASGNFDLKAIKNIVLSFNKNADVGKLDDIAFSYDLSCLKDIFDAIYVKGNEISILTFSIVANLFLVSGGYIPLPMLDIAKPVIQGGNDFYNILLDAIKSTMDILAKHKKMVKEHSALVEQANMKSVVAEYYYLLESPVIEVGQMLEDLEMTFATLSKATAILENDKILKKIAGSQRYRIFKYDALCKLFSD